MKSAIALAATAALLHGCAALPESSADLMASPGHVAETTLRAPADIVYRKVVEQMSVCAARIGPRARVVADKSGLESQITLLSSTVVTGSSVYVVLVLSPAGGSTKATQYSPRKGLPTIPVDTLTGWVERGEKGCF